MVETEFYVKGAMCTMKFQLNDGNIIPPIGFGVFMIPPKAATYEAVKAAIDAGYRHVDTAAAYFNEADVGRAIRESGIPREDIFVTSKLWLQDYGYEAAKKGIDTSLKKLQLEYMDMYLLHQPYGDVLGAWTALEAAKKEGKIRSIGVSNMTVNIWDQWVPQFDTMPAVNQVEYNPFFQQRELKKKLDAINVRLEAWYPLGHGNKDLLEHPLVLRMAEKYEKNGGQIVLRFAVQEGVIVLPKSTNAKRMKGNLDIFDFSLTNLEMESIRALDMGKGIHNPDEKGVAERLLSAFNVHVDE